MGGAQIGYHRRMRTLAVLAFIAGVAVAAIALAGRTTIADGRVMAVDLLDQLREHGVQRMACDREIPIGRHGAVFTCRATLDTGATQIIEYTMDRAGGLSASLAASPAKPAAPAPHRRIPSSGDPWADRP